MEKTNGTLDAKHIAFQLSKIEDMLKLMNDKIDKACPFLYATSLGNGNVERIKRIVETSFGLPPQALDRKTRLESIVWPRQVAMALVKEFHELPFQAIADAFFKLDHGTAINACELVKRREQTDPKVKIKLDAIRAIITKEESPRQIPQNAEPKPPYIRRGDSMPPERIQ